MAFLQNINLFQPVFHRVHYQGLHCFVLYINDSSDGLTFLARLFADDTAQIENTMHQDLNKLNHLAKKWLVTLNRSKPEVMFISNIYFKENIELTVNGTVC